MKIKVISNRRPWIDGQPREMGWEGEVDAASADAMIANGLVEKKMGRPAKKDDTDDVEG